LGSDHLSIIKSIGTYYLLILPHTGLHSWFSFFYSGKHRFSRVICILKAEWHPGNDKEAPGSVAFVNGISDSGDENRFS
jgi:hypothetical protein